MKKMLIGVALILVMGLAACGETTDSFERLEEDLLEEVDSWENVSMSNENEATMTEGDDFHMNYNLHKRGDQELYFEIYDLLEEEEKLVTYIYMDETHIYRYNYVPDGDDEYTKEAREGVDDVPDHFRDLVQVLSTFPRESELEGDELEAFDVEYNLDDKTFDVHAETTFTMQDGEDKLFEWYLDGDFESFELKSPLPLPGSPFTPPVVTIMTFENTDAFFDDFEGIDKSLHE